MPQRPWKCERRRDFVAWINVCCMSYVNIGHTTMIYPDDIYVFFSLNCTKACVPSLSYCTTAPRSVKFDIIALFTHFTTLTSLYLPIFHHIDSVFISHTLCTRRKHPYIHSHSLSLSCLIQTQQEPLALVTYHIST